MYGYDNGDSYGRSMQNSKENAINSENGEIIARTLLGNGIRALRNEQTVDVARWQRDVGDARWLARGGLHGSVTTTRRGACDRLRLPVVH